MQATLRASLAERLRDGHTQASLVLDELSVRADEIDAANVPALVSALFEMADDLDVPEDGRRAFELVDNQLRLRWLVSRLVRERFELPKRSTLLTQACQHAAVGWLADFTHRCRRERSENSRGESVPPVDRLVEEAALDALARTALDRLRAAAADGSLTDSRRLVWLLHVWAELSLDGIAEVQRWTALQLDQERFIIAFAAAATSTSWSHGASFSGLGGRVARGAPRVSRDGLDRIIDVPRLLERVEELDANQDLSDLDRATLDRFRQGWRATENE